MSARITGIILAADLSSRMGEANKLTTLWQGKPLVAHVAQAALQSCLTSVVVVTGHQAREVAIHLPDDVTQVFNPDYASGMASSLCVGVAVSGDADGAMILLGDMPLVTQGHIDQMIAAFSPEGSGSIVQACSDGGPGNPVLFSRLYFEELAQSEGDSGPKNVIRRHGSIVRHVDIGEAARRDFDNPEAFGLQG